MTEMRFEGIDGANPLGFLAAVGLLDILESGNRTSTPVRLRFRDEGRWRPVFELPDDSPDIMETLLVDLEAWRDNPALDFEYERESRRTTRIIQDLKPPPARFRELLEEAERSYLELQGEDRRFADIVAAFATETGRDHGGQTKPTAFHFTAGKQLFLTMVNQLADGVEPDDFEEALHGPWSYESALPDLRWDVKGERLYALLASDPSSDKKKGVAGANWLAFRALPMFPCMPHLGRTVTTGFVGRGNNQAFRWPIWDVPGSRAAVRSLLSYPSLPDLTSEERKALGIAQILEANVHRSSSGYGDFRAPEVV